MDEQEDGNKWTCLNVRLSMRKLARKLCGAYKNTDDFIYKLLCDEEKDQNAALQVLAAAKGEGQ
jgi:hypothetical protein